MKKATRVIIKLIPCLISTAFILLLFLFAGCSRSDNGAIPSELENWLNENGKVKVLSTTGIIGDLVSQVGKEWVDSLSLIFGDIDPHTYELVKGDDEKLSFAKIIFSNGLGLEHGASLQRRLQLHPLVVSLGNEIQDKYPDLILKKEKQVDPHIWMDVSLWEKAIDPIVVALSNIDPTHAEEYQKNGNILKASLLNTDNKMYELLQSIEEEKRYLVTSHDAFNYFTRRYLSQKDEVESDTWQKRCIAPEGLAPEGQLSVADIQEVIQQIKLHRIHVLFPESNVGKDSLKKIIYACKEKGLNVRLADEPLYADAMGPLSSAAGTYKKMMEHDAEVIAKGWNNEPE